MTRGEMGLVIIVPVLFWLAFWAVWRVGYAVHTWGIGRYW